MAVQDQVVAPVSVAVQISRAAVTATRYLLGAVLIGLVLLNVANALARATGAVVIGVDEVLVFGMIWMVMLGMLVVTAEGNHITFELVTSRVRPRTRDLLMITTQAVLALSCGYAAYQSFLFVQRITVLSQTSMALGMPMLIPHSALIVGFGGTAVIAALLAATRLQRFLAGEESGTAA